MFRVKTPAARLCLLYTRGEKAFMKPQYGHLNKTYTMTVPNDIPTWTWKISQGFILLSNLHWCFSSASTLPIDKKSYVFLTQALSLNKKLLHADLANN